MAGESRLIAVVASFIAAVVFVLNGCSRKESTPLVREPIGNELIYEIDTDVNARRNTEADYNAIAAIVERRVNGNEDRGEVSVLNNGRIRIGLFGRHAETVARVKRMLSRKGTLEFRILANRKYEQDASIINRAEASDNDVVKSDSSDSDNATDMDKVGPVSAP